MSADLKFACPCCLFLTLEHRGTYDICPVCFWEDDGNNEEDFRTKDYLRSGPNNGLDILEARRNFERFGAVEDTLATYTRKPLTSEIPDTQN